MKEYTVKVYDNGDKEWYLNDQRHRKDGPAIEWSDGSKAWFLKGVNYSEEEFFMKTQSRDSLINKIVADYEMGILDVPSEKGKK